MLKHDFDNPWVRFDDYGQPIESEIVTEKPRLKGKGREGKDRELTEGQKGDLELEKVKNENEEFLGLLENHIQTNIKGK